MNMKGQVKRSVKVLRRSEKHDVIPPVVLQRAYGIVFMTQIKGAYLISGTIGTGIFMKRMDNNTWTPPVSVGMASVGIGLQIGGQKVDLVIILNDKKAVKAFESHGQLKLGGDYSVSAGPVGRKLAADLAISGNGFSGSYSYSMSQGLFVGFSLEGQVLVSRGGDNRSFYENKEAKLDAILNMRMPVPDNLGKNTAVKVLHQVLNNIIRERSFDFGLENIDGNVMQTVDLDIDDSVADEDDDSKALAVAEQPVAQATAQKALSARQSTHEEVGKALLVGALDAHEPASGPPPIGVGPSTRDLLGLTDPVQPTALATKSSNYASPAWAVAAPAANNPFSQSSDSWLNSTATGDELANGLLTGLPRYAVIRDHDIDESSVQMMTHNIIRVLRGDPLYLVEDNMSPPYQDYVTVQRMSDAKIGKVSKFCIAPIM